MTLPETPLGAALAVLLREKAPANASADLRRRIMERSVSLPQRSRWMPGVVPGGRLRTSLLVMAGAAFGLLLAALGLLNQGPSDLVGPSPTPTETPTPAPTERRQAGPWREGAPARTDRIWFLGGDGGSIWALIEVQARTATLEEIIHLVEYVPARDLWEDHGTVDPRISALAGDAPGAVRDGRVYLFGYDDAVTRLEAWWMDVDTLRSPLGRPVPVASGMAASAAGDGPIYLLNTPRYSMVDQGAQSLHAYDRSTDAWRDLPALPMDRAGSLLAADREGRAYVVGGTSLPFCDEISGGGTQCTSDPLTSVVRYDPGTDSWEDLPNLPDLPNPDYTVIGADYGAATVGRDGALYLAYPVEAPEAGPGQIPEVLRTRIDRFDPVTEAWSEVVTLPGSLLPKRLESTDDGWLALFGLSLGTRAAGEWNVSVTWVTQLPGA